MQNSSDEGGFLNSTCTTPFDQQKFINVGIVNLTIGAISFTSSILMITIILLAKKWKFFSERLILYLTITAMLFSLANVLNRLDFNGEKSEFYSGWCVFTGAMTQITTWMTMFAITSISIYLFFRTILKSNSERFEAGYLVLIFLVPFLFNWIPFISMEYGRAGVWCWIRSFDMETCSILIFGKWWQFGMLYIPAYLLLAILLILYIIIIIKLLKGSSKTLTKTIVWEVATLLAYPGTYFLLSLPIFINRIYTSFELYPSLTLWYLSGIALPLIGFSNAVIFTLVNVCGKKKTWTNLRAMTTGRKSTRKIQDYYIKDGEISDSMPRAGRLNTVKYVAYLENYAAPENCV